jgi:uncharacterized surface protein with fasciclin (FAS1) repeats
MKQFLFAAITALGCHTLLVSCSRDALQPISISDVVQQESDFGTLRAAIEYAGLRDALKTGNFTFFAPTDAAFKASGYPDAASLTKLPVQQVRDLLTYHLLPKEMTAENFAFGENYPIYTLTKDSVFVTKNEVGVSVLGAKVIRADLQASNGVVHAVDKIIQKPTQNLSDLLKQTPDLSLFRQAVDRVSEAFKLPFLLVIPTVPNDNSVNTIFAPNNKAMEAASYNSETIRTTREINKLASIVYYHIARGRYYSSIIERGRKIPTYYPNTTVETKLVNGQLTVIGAKNDPKSPGTLVGADIVATNGVIHIIDRVLLP